VTRKPVVDDGEATMVLYLRRGRSKARAVAAAEAAALMRGLGASIARGGPLAERRGVVWLRVPESNVSLACNRLRRLGYCGAVDLVRPAADAPATAHTVRWKRRESALIPIYREPDDSLRAEAPDRRQFALERADGSVRTVTGYRGGSGALTHRGLPVVDARMLVNLVFAPTGGRLLDPFAGAGGIVIAARACGWKAISFDHDATLRYGLRQLADFHAVASASAMPLASESIDAIASEPPYHPSALDTVVASIAEIARVLRPGARLSLLIATTQAQAVRRAAEAAGLRLELDERIDRKGTGVVCLCWEKRPE
jgi:SAM-dependent methyltransferase